MKNIRLAVILASVVSPFMLAACGDGYEAVPYHGIPYVEERTAGAGVAYVRAHLLPEKGPILLPAQITPQSETVIEDAAPLFSGKQLKK